MVRFFCVMALISLGSTAMGDSPLAPDQVRCEARIHWMEEGEGQFTTREVTQSRQGVNPAGEDLLVLRGGVTHSGLRLRYEMTLTSSDALITINGGNSVRSALQTGGSIYWSVGNENEGYQRTVVCRRGGQPVLSRLSSIECSARYTSANGTTYYRNAQSSAFGQHFRPLTFDAGSRVAISPWVQASSVGLWVGDATSHDNPLIFVDPKLSGVTTIQAPGPEGLQVTYTCIGR